MEEASLRGGPFPSTRAAHPAKVPGGEWYRGGPTVPHSHWIESFNLQEGGGWGNNEAASRNVSSIFSEWAANAILWTGFKRGENCTRLYDVKLWGTANEDLMQHAAGWRTGSRLRNLFFFLAPSHSFFDWWKSVPLIVADRRGYKSDPARLPGQLQGTLSSSFCHQYCHWSGRFLSGGGLLLFGESQLAWLSNGLTLSCRRLGCNLNTLNKSWKKPQYCGQKFESLKCHQKSE